MLYFSEIKDKPVFLDNHEKIGKLVDVVFLGSDEALITKIVIKKKNNQLDIVPLKYINRLNDNIVLKKKYDISKIEDNELFLVKNLLDKQIIDINGHKIVRVNDVLIQEKPNVNISAVDIGLLGILRWFNLARFFRNKIKESILSWNNIQPLELSKGKVKLKMEEEKLDRIRPEDLADYLETTNIHNIEEFLARIDEELKLEVIENLQSSVQTALFKKLTSKKASRILSMIEPDEAVDILLTLNSKKRQEIIDLFSEEKKNEINYLLKFSKTPIGDLITSEYLIVSNSDTVKGVLNKIQKQTKEFDSLYYIYVTNDKKQITGVVNLHELILEKQDTPIYKFMTQNLIVVHLTTPIELAIKKMLKYRIYSLPVVNSNKNVLGVVFFDDISESMLENL